MLRDVHLYEIYAKAELEEFCVQLCSNGRMPGLRRQIPLHAGAEAKNIRHRDGGADAQHSHAPQRAAPGALH